MNLTEAIELLMQLEPGTVLHIEESKDRALKVEGTFMSEKQAKEWHIMSVNDNHKGEA